VNTLVGTGALIRLILRRDRFLLPLWVIPLGLVPLALASSVEGLYPTAAARQGYADDVATNSTLLTLYGHVYGSDLGSLTAWRTSSSMVFVALFTLLTVIRHTRTEEEAGRRELVGSAVVGRQAPLAAALVVAFGANLVLAVVAGLGLISLGLPAGGAFTLGLSWAAVGWIFAAVGAVAAQLPEGAGAARGIAVTVLGVAFALRAVGDASGTDGGVSWLSWLSPLGWAQHVHAFADERWWIFAVAAGVIAVLTAVAVVLSAGRDVAGGVLPARLGPATASPRLRSPLALAWRLHRSALLGWTAGFVALGAVFGGAAKGAGDLVNDNEQLGEIFARLGGKSALSDVFIAGAMSILALIAAAYAVQASLRLRSEETALRAEPVLATAVGRLKWAASHLVFALLGPTVAMAAAGLTAGLLYGLSTGDVGRELPRALAGAMVQLPAVWVLAGITVALFGLLPRLAALGWAALAVCVFLGQLGAVLQLGQSVLDISPFTHSPKVPGGDVTAAPLAWMLALAVALTAAGLVGFRRRDVG
jgi:ABC-2 type transport system permease protein